MRTVTFQSVYEAILRFHGLDPLADALTHDTARALAEHITSRCQTAWAMWDWPELMVTEERAYRQVWINTRQYRRVSEDGLPDEVYYIPSAKYYRAGGTLSVDPPVGQAPTNTAYWHPLDPVTTFVARDQVNRLPMGQVFGVYGRNPSLNGCCSESCLRFRPSEKGVTICDGPATTVFVQYLLPEPEYTFVPFIAFKDYVVGQRVFNPADGNCYRCIANNNNQTPPNSLFWALEPVPAMFATYLKEGAYADSLMETFPAGEDQVRVARAAAADQKASRNIEGLIDDLLEQGQKHYYIRHRWPHVSWSYDGTLWWPTTGWCCSRPWSGNVVVPLTDVPATVGPSPGPPSGAPGMIYLPQIVSLSAPEPSLKSFPTVNLAVDTLVVITIGDQEQMWRLDAGVADPSDPGQLSPADYNVVTNNKKWTKVG